MVCEVGTVVEAYNLVSHKRWGSDVVYGMFPITVVAPMAMGIGWDKFGRMANRRQTDGKQTANRWQTDRHQSKFGHRNAECIQS